MSSFNNRIALLHELGHSKQFIERPEWYRFYAGAKTAADEQMKLKAATEKEPVTHRVFREELEDKATRFWTKKLTPPKPKPVAAPAPVAGPGAAGGPPPPPPEAPQPPTAPTLPGAPAPPTAPGLPAALGGPNVRQQLGAILPARSERPKDQTWFVVIDVDNMQRHEWPICTEMGLPIRMHYTDLSA
jgi:hypothetical protein